MSRRVSFWILAGTVVAVGIFFFRVIQPFLLPLFLSVVLALLFRPFYERVVRWCRGHRRVAAVLTTGAILSIVILPVAVMLVLAGQELITLANELLPSEIASGDPALRRQMAEVRQTLTDEEFSQLRRGILSGQSPTAALPSPEDPAAAESLGELEYNFPQDAIREYLQSVSVADVLEPQKSPWFENLRARLEPYVPPETVGRLGRSAAAAVSAAFADIYRKTRSFIADVVQFVIGFAVMTLALYYFLADGPRFVETLKPLLPLEAADEETLFRQFDEICRGVVLGSVVAALAQAVLLGIGLALAGLEHVWLLAGLTMISAMIPFLGAAGVYVPVTAYLLLQQRYGAAVFVLAYGAALVSTADNLIRAHVLHGRSRLHPLVGVISVLGALQLIGLWGIFIGPVVAGFFYGLLKILHAKLEQSESEARPEGASDGNDSARPRETDIVVAGQ